MIQCNKCWMLKIDAKSKCLCTVKPFNEKKLSKKTKEVKKPTPIKQISEKKKTRLKENWSEWELFKKIYKKLAKNLQNECTICSEVPDLWDYIDY